ncbi:MAG: aspartate aminotransferase family protein [Candidatus Bathyarchaeota archaeon]
MNKEKIIETDQTFMAPLFWKRPIAIERGQGAYLYDTEDNIYLDFTSNYGVAITGHSHPRVVQAITDQAEKLISCHGSFYNQQRSLFIEKLSEMTPKNLSRYYFSNSGTESVECALKFARKATGKKGFVAMMNCFHGKTMGSLSLTWNKKYREPFMPLLQDVRHVPFGKTDRLLDVITEDTAAVILEPIQGESGINIPPEGYLKEVRDICSDKDVLLILDEIQTGTGRTGRFLAAEHSDVQPDIVCLSKALASGFPLGATLCTEEVASTLKVGDHSSTFGGNPLACAAGKATLEVIQDEKLLNRATTMGNYLLTELQCLLDYSCVREVRGKGLMLAIEMKFDALTVIMSCIEKRMLVLEAGRNVVRLLPPLVLTMKDADTAVQILREVIGEEDSARKSGSPT